MRKNPHDKNARSRDHDNTRSQIRTLIEKGRQAMVLVSTNGASTSIEMGRALGRDGTPIVWMVDETAELCARHADALAGEAEQIAREVMAQVDELSHGNLLAGVRRAFGMHGSLRRLAGQLGELHTVLDELAHHARRPGGA